MIEHPLLALRESSPFHALVAMGVLRVAVEDLGMNGASLSWRGGHATLRAPENLFDELARYAPERGGMPEYTKVGSTRGIDPERFVALSEEMPRWMPGIATIAALTREGAASSTRWDMTAGQQQLLKGAATLLTGRLPRGINWHDRLRSGLVTGDGEEKGSSFGLDPESYRSHALSAFSPSQSNLRKKIPLPIPCSAEPATRHPARVWFAVESLPLHPVMRSATGRAVTPGWRSDVYHWLVWDAYLGLPAVRALIGTVGQPDGEWAARGFREYAAPQVSLGDYGAMRSGFRIART